MTSAPTLKMISLDCSDVRAQARFWSELLGYPIAHVQDEYAMLVGSDGAPAVGFGQVEGFEPPAWPDPAGGKRFHFDLACDDVAAVEERAVELGATLAEPQPGETWRVLLDPAGHPFCLTAAANW
ncbi:VOC family protein [Nocardioides sp. R-C-SC26]|uniref:VOC family protein n=1 Tax=Nocardioides sp. R-C-SC26 TaxID=2870414 RepID=UPI001E2DAD7F|nr:VOC family protein [Nocardioides sp. R-C-SC26]